MTRRPTHPGNVFLEDVMKPLNLTVTDAARMLVHRIINTCNKSADRFFRYKAEE